MSSRRPSGDYEVGYGKPPKKHQFKPGQSGNPKGRKKKLTRVPDIATALDRVLSREMMINDNGQTRKVDVLEAMILNLLASGMRGNFRALQAFVKLVQAFPPTQERFYGYDPEDADRALRKIQEMVSRRQELERLRAESLASTNSSNAGSAATQENPSLQQTPPETKKT